MLIQQVRSGAIVSVYLILRQEGKVLLHLRKNTGYCDGEWGLVSGHVEDGESATQAMVREAYEEASIQIEPCYLNVVHVAHSRTDRYNIGIFFTCSKWEGCLVNREPEKCTALEYFPLKELPSNTIDCIRYVLQAIDSAHFYSEYGWKS